MMIQSPIYTPATELNNEYKTVGRVMRAVVLLYPWAYLQIPNISEEIIVDKKNI